MSPFRASAPLTDRWEHFRFSVSDGIATVTLDRPGKLNALTFQAYADLMFMDDNSTAQIAPGGR